MRRAGRQRDFSLPPRIRRFHGAGTPIGPPTIGSGDVAVLYAFDLLEYDGSDLRRMKPAR
jgi:hypothetical protein